MFKQEIKSIGLSLEQGTPSAPDDDQFFVLLRGKVVFAAPSKRKALIEYQRRRDELIDATGSARDRESARNALKREVAEAEAMSFLAASARQKKAKATSRGGRGG